MKSDELIKQRLDEADIAHFWKIVGKGGEHWVPGHANGKVNADTARKVVRMYNQMNHQERRQFKAGHPTPFIRKAVGQDISAKPDQPPSGSRDRAGSS